MPDKPESNLEYWALLYNDCLVETDPLKLESIVVALEEAISHRLRELNGKAGGQHETLALETAANSMPKIKTTKLGFPAAWK
jgi:hypothetical protein